MDRLYPKRRFIPAFLLLFGAFFLANRLSAQPTHIAYFTPTRAGMGATVSIHGSGFTGTSYVAFGGYSALSFTVYQDTMISAVVGHGGNGYVLVTGVHGADSLAGFSYSNSDSPLIYSYSPRSGSPGTVVTINGARLTGTTAVSFGGTAATAFTVVSDTVIRATVGYGSTGSVNVNTPFGVASATGFTYIPPAGATHIRYFTPATGKTGTLVQIHGNYFTGTNWVSFGGVHAQSVSVVSDTLINAAVGTGATGQVLVSGVNGPDSLAGFVYQDTTVTVHTAVRSFGPASGKTGDTILIRGVAFTGTTIVRFGGVNAMAFTVVDDTLINATVGFGATGQVWVSTPNGADSLPGFVYVNSNTHTVLHSFTPDSARTGTTVHIYGAGLTTVSVVRFGGVNAASFTIVSDTLINAVVGTGASGLVFVSGPHGLDSLPGFVFIDSSRGDTTKSRVFRLVSLTIGSAGSRPELRWQTVYDESIAGYEVEQGTDTTHFTPVGVVASQRKDSAAYVFTDSVVRTGLNYYYLRMIDTAGHVTNSQMMAIKLPLVPSTLSGFPNPAPGSMVVPVPQSASTSKITVSDMSGNVVRTIIVPPNAGPVRVDLHGLNKGVYKIVWSNGASSAYQTVLVWN